MNPKETSKLTVGEDGVLKKTGIKEISINDYKNLIEINYEPKNNWLVLQPLPEKETKLSSGILLPESKKEFKCAIVAAPTNSEYKRGMVVRVDPMMFGGGPKVDYIENQPILDCPDHFIKGVYTKIDLSNWKSDNK